MEFDSMAGGKGHDGGGSIPTIIRLTDNSFDQDVPRFAERMVQDTVEYPSVGALLYQLLADDGVR